MRTKAEVRAFLNSKVGHTCVDKSDARLNGQCVCLVKNVMDFLGVPNPYAARGNAKDAGDTYIAQNIGENGRGWLTIVVNRDMGVVNGIRYGHIWIDLRDEANYESNGAKALITTKNTRPISQGQQFINLDKWIKGEEVIGNENHVKILFKQFGHGTPSAAEIKDYKSKTLEYALNKLYPKRIDLLTVIKERDALKAKLAAATTPPPAVVDKAVVVDYINKNLG